MITALAIYAALLFAAYSVFLASIAARRREQVRELRHTIHALKTANRGLASHARTLEHAARAIDLDSRRRVSEAEQIEAVAWEQRSRMQRQLARAKGPA